ncbi:MAG: hypothetical protein WC795_00675 [Candidatus Paceibacterota bacterium]|jgi:hypothetical protein
MINEKPKYKIFDPVADIASKFDFYIKIVIGVLVVGFISMLLMVGGIILDAWHFNSATYREYSKKTESVETMQKINQELLEQNKRNQEIIIELQKRLLNK